METTLLKLSVGDPTSTEEVTLNGSKAIAWNYPYFIAYERDGKIVAWKQLQEIKEGALDTAIEAYNKAYELDPKQSSKIKNGLEQISNYASILGNVSIEAGEYLTGAEAYLAAYKAQQCPAFGEADPALLYYAGYLLTVDVQPEHQMEKVLYATDELTGLIGAVVRMLPTKSVQDLQLKSLKKKFKDKKFAAGCSR